MKVLQRLLTTFLIWRIKHVSNKNFLLILSSVVGILSGLAAVLLKWSVHEVYYLFTGDIEIQNVSYLYFIYPFLGVVVTVLLAKYVFNESFGHGITNILYAISKGSSLVKRRVMATRMIGSALTVGLGGSVGLEAPIVVTGSAIGANVGHAMHMNYKMRTILIGCGSSAAIAAIFNSPIAGVVFSIEVILAEVSIDLFIPLLISSVSGTVISILLAGESLLFKFNLTESFRAPDIPFYIGLGIFCGLIAVHFTRSVYFVEDKIYKIKNDLNRALIGGAILGLLVFLFPPFYGEGYASIKMLINDDPEQMLNTTFLSGYGDNTLVLLVFILAMIVFKAVASATTIGAGGCGGIFAPSMFIGGLTGFFYSRVINFTGLGQVSTTNFTLVGMCGIMSGVFHAPLTGIFLIAEITGGYTLFIPLMLVAAISYVTISYFEPHSIYTKKLIESGDLTHSKDKQVLNLINLHNLIEKNFKTIHPESTLDDLIEVVKVSKRNIFPVINSEGILVGLLTLDDIRQIMFDEEQRKSVLVKTMMHTIEVRINQNEDMNKVMSKFERSGKWNLPVVTKEGKYIGFVSRANIFNAYRKRLIRQHRNT